MGSTSFLGGHTTNHFSSVSNCVLRVESTLLASETLADYSGILVDPNIGRRAEGAGALRGNARDGSECHRENRDRRSGFLADGRNKKREFF